MFSLRGDEAGLTGAQNPSDAQAGPPGASISSTRTPWHERGWRNATGPSAPRRGAESISSMPSISRRRSVSARFGTSKQTWWKPSPLLGEEAGDAGRVVGRLDELDLRLPHPEERDPDAVVRDVHDRLELEAERVAPEAERVLDRAHDERDVVDLADRGGRSPGGARRAAFGGIARSVPCRPWP